MGKYVGKFNKQPAETFPVTVDFADRLATGETVSSIAVTATDADGNDVAGTIVESSSLSTPVATVIVKAGTDGEKYTITVRSTTDAATPAVHEADILMRVSEVPG